MLTGVQPTKLVLLAAALALNGLAGLVILSPNVSVEYRDYYIDRTSKRWLQGTPRPTVPVNTPLSFAPQTLGDAILGAGWSDPDGDGAWSIGRTAHLLFRVPTNLGTDFDLVLGGIASPSRDGSASARVSVNGRELRTLTLSSAAVTEYRIRVPHSRVTEPGGYIEIEIRLGDHSWKGRFLSRANGRVRFLLKNLALEPA